MTSTSGLVTTNEFDGKLAQFVTLDEQLKEGKRALMELKPVHTELADWLLEYLTMHNVSEYSLGGNGEKGVLRVKTAKKKKRPDREAATAHLAKLAKISMDDADTIYEHIYGSGCPSVEKQVIRRVGPRGSGPAKRKKPKKSSA